MESKQTAVQWLIQQVKSKEWQDKFIWHKEDVFEEAKAMEKEQIESAVIFGDYRGKVQTYVSAEQYYNETYKK